MWNRLTGALMALSDGEQVLVNEPMAKYTTFRVGGPADILFFPADTRQLARALELAAQEDAPVCVIGNGSNLLVRDGGIRGLVIRLGERMSEINIKGSYVFAQAGASLALVSRAAMENGLTGLEFASGIPGTVGGGMAMNAGAYGGELGDVLEEAEVYRDGVTEIWSRERFAPGYRTTAALREGAIVLSVVLKLTQGDQQGIREKMNELNRRRREKQPLSMPSAGSTFKRPQGYFAGALIDQAQLRGTSVGGAQVSTLHAGFIVNTGSATARDILDLIELVQKRVFETSGVRLEPEVRILGEG